MTAVHSLTPRVLTDADKANFVEQGYIILPGLVPEEKLYAADAAIAESRELAVSGAVDVPPLHFAQESPAVTALFGATQLRDAAADLLGPDLVVRDAGAAQVAITTGDPATDLTTPLNTSGWHVDSSHGPHAALASDFLLLAGVALSRGQDVDENRGQLLVFPGSHLKTHANIKELTETSRHPVQVAQKFRNAAVDAGEPKRVLLRRGDVVLAHQRLAHKAGPNAAASGRPRVNVYFRVSVPSFERHLPSYCLSATPWVLFSGLSTVLPDPSFTSPTSTIMTSRDLLTLHPAKHLKIVLSNEDTAHFVAQGYIVVRDAVSPELVRKAVRKLDTAVRNGKFSNPKSTANGRGMAQHLVFNDHVGSSTVLTDVLVKSCLVSLVSCLLGESNVMLLDAKADIVVTRCITEDGNEHGEKDSEKRSSDEHCIGDDIGVEHGVGVRKGGWDVSIGKGRYWRRGADHLVRVSVALTDTLAGEHNGAVVVWPGSHFGIHDMVRDVVKNNEPADRAKAYRQAKRKTKCGDPVQLRLRAGDAVIKHQRLATAFAPNLQDHNSQMLQFRLHPYDFAEDVGRFVLSDSPFTLFDGLQGRDVREISAIGSH